MVSSKDTLQYESDFAKQVRASWKVNAGTGINTRLEVSMTIFTIHRKQDVDSFPKVILDCMQRNNIIYNDNRIDALHVWRKIDKENPRAEISVEVLK